MMDAFKKFTQHVVPGVVKPLRVLWNEMIGFLFLVFAVMLVRPVWLSYQAFDGDLPDLFKLVLSAFFMLVMMLYGLHAFWKARRIKKS